MAWDAARRRLDVFSSFCFLLRIYTDLRSNAIENSMKFFSSDASAHRTNVNGELRASHIELRSNVDVALALTSITAQSTCPGRCLMLHGLTVQKLIGKILSDK